LQLGRGLAQGPVETQTGQKSHAQRLQRTSAQDSQNMLRTLLRCPIVRMKRLLHLAGPTCRHACRWTQSAGSRSLSHSDELHDKRNRLEHRSLALAGYGWLICFSACSVALQVPGVCLTHPSLLISGRFIQYFRAECWSNSPSGGRHSGTSSEKIRLVV
jgi:hypothetical protein